MKNVRDGAVLLAKSPITQSRILLGRFLRPILLVLGFFYFGFHTFHGERGLYALVREEQQLHSLKKELAQTKAAREKIELRVSHLRDGSIDLDLLDEQMRRMLGVSRPGEVMLLD